jgi:hypothetical protein
MSHEPHHEKDGLGEMHTKQVPRYGRVAVTQEFPMEDSFEFINGFVFGSHLHCACTKSMPKAVKSRMALSRSLEKISNVASDEEEHHLGCTVMLPWYLFHSREHVAVINVGWDSNIASKDHTRCASSSEFLGVAFKHHDLPPETPAHLRLEWR